jgi:lysophospholipase L1-like esterase
LPNNNTQNTPQGTFLFIGDSLIADFDWQGRMPLFKVHNYGVHGENVQDLLTRLPNIEQEVTSAEIILVMIGINNIISEDYAFIDQLRKVIIRLRKKYPQADIIINSLPPIKIELLVDNAITHLNENIEEIAHQTGCCYLSNFAKTEGKGGEIFQEDGIHLTGDTYEVWARSILEYVAFLLEDD